MFFNYWITYSRPRILVLLKALLFFFFFQKRQISTVELKLAPISKAPDKLYIPGPIAFWPRGKVSSLLIVHPVQNPEVMSSILHSCSHLLQEKLCPTALGLCDNSCQYCHTCHWWGSGQEANGCFLFFPHHHPSHPDHTKALFLTEKKRTKHYFMAVYISA